MLAGYSNRDVSFFYSGAENGALKYSTACWGAHFQRVSLVDGAGVICLYFYASMRLIFLFLDHLTFTFCLYFPCLLCLLIILVSYLKKRNSCSIIRCSLFY